RTLRREDSPARSRVRVPTPHSLELVALCSANSAKYSRILCQSRRQKWGIFGRLGASKLIAASGFNIPVDWAPIKRWRSEPAGAAERLSTSPFRTWALSADECSAVCVHFPELKA